MPADAAEIVRLAGSLTKAQEAFLLTGRGHSMAQVACDRKGLTILVPVGRLKFDRIITQLGIAVRDHLRARAQHDHEVG